MKNVLKVLFVIVILGLAGFGLYLLTQARQWPWWVGCGLFLGLAGIWSLVVFLIRFVRRRREREFIQRVIAEDDAAIHKAPARERQALQNLQQHWAESIELLRGSFLRKQGNPLYVLPWYIVIGESGAGKTSAICRSGLSSVLGEQIRAKAIASTRNCDWWFFEQAVILDTAGRYAIPLDEGPDKEEWQRFLSLLAQFRRREPVSGVIVAIPADQLLANDTAKLREDALDIRRRIDHLMRSLGANAPVYVMVTKMDRVLGMTGFAAALPDQVDQAMGYTNESKDPHWEQVFQRAMGSVSQRLRELRFQLVRRVPDTDPGLLLFPAEFEKLQAGLGHFLRPLFEETPYLEVPLLRGLFFTSAVPEAQPESEFLSTFNLREQVPAKAGPGLFLEHFFATILPRDRHVHRPIREFLDWARTRRHLGFLVWYLLWFGALGLLGAAFTQNLKAVRIFSSSWHALPKMSGDVGKDLIAVDRMRLELIAMKRVNRHWWVPRFGLDHSLRVEAAVQSSWLGIFREGLLMPLGEAVNQAINAPGGGPKDPWVGDYVSFTATRIALTQDYLDGVDMNFEHPPAALDSFTKASAELLQKLHPGLSPEVAGLLGDNYLGNIMWYGQPAVAQQAVKELRWSLTRLLDREGSDLQWITAKWIPDAPAVELMDFWGEPEQSFGPKPSIHGAYTQEGRKHIEAYLDLLGRALGDPALLKPRLPIFWDWYREQLLASWQTFGKRFGEGEAGIRSSLGCESMATLMTTRQNPYFKLLDRMASELGSLHDPQPAPWTRLVRQLGLVRSLADQQLLEKSNASTLDKLAAKKREQFRNWEGRLDPQKSEDFDLCMNGSKPWLDYLANLRALNAAVLSRQTAFHQMAPCFGGRSDGGEEAAQGETSPFLLAHASITELEVQMGRGNDCQIIWNLVRGPLDYVLDHSLEQAAVVLQERWNENVLGGLQGSDPDQLRRMLFGADGKVWAFLKGPARPFVMKNGNGYAPRPAFDQRTLPFHPAFFDFLRAGNDNALAFQPSFSVTLETLPLEVSPGAKVVPIGSKLCLQSAESGQTCLENFNYSQNALFKWVPESSGGVRLSIQLPSLTLTRNYPGTNGFPHFLAEFETGARTFTAKDFPEAESQLRALDIKWIRAAYRIQGGTSVLRFLRRSPTAVPQTIVELAETD